MPEITPAAHAATSRSARPAPDRLLLVYDGDSGVGAMLLDVAKKAVGREDCPLCEITYSPLGKRRAWRACEAKLGLPVDELHRDRLPSSWGIARDELPCVLACAGAEPPWVLVSREEIVACNGSPTALERRLRDALAGGAAQASSSPP